MNESPSKSKFDLFEEHDLSENVRHPLLSWDDYSPSWEQKFIAGVESMRTIPHVSLMRFSFIKVNFQDVGNANPTSGFSPATSISSSVSLNKTNESISTPRNSTTGQSDSEATTTTRTIESPNTSKRSEDMGNEPVRFKTSPSASSTTSRHMKRSLSKFLRPKRIKKRIDLLRSEPESSRTNHGSKGRNVDAPRSLPMLLNPNDSVYVALQLFRLNNPLYDYNEVQRKRRVKKMNQILDKDDGPFYINYREMLGIDFWCNFCEIEKSELKQLMSSSMWPESRGELARRFIEEKCEQIREKELSWLQKKAQLFVDARKFFQGRLQPVRPPRRVIRPEEKFRVVSYGRLLNPNSDLKQITTHKSIKTRSFNLIKRLYISYVYWSEIKAHRVVSMEEALEDLLIWILDEDQAKTRFIALLKDQIKKEIS